MVGAKYIAFLTIISVATLAMGCAAETNSPMVTSATPDVSAYLTVVNDSGKYATDVQVPKGKLVLQIISPRNISIYVPGYDVYVLESENPDVMADGNYSLQLMQHSRIFYQSHWIAPKELVNGTIVEISHYQFNDSRNEIHVNVHGDSDDDWNSVVRIRSH
ncbi:hypothetical protein [Methanocella sp. MCL-LM]|uniref:hypothetical protein n=1 Tax=Methanocella sp. MCL-LM TaxID=3412035 RepID=UPI003C70C625